ncbi:MAG: hypothetical protein IJU69_07790 [Bacteroidales bacterium]|nr:hypothetical protein [Bacteroidales bacterium]
MKRVLLLFSIVFAAFLLPQKASAQYFDHMSLGVGLGTDGVSLHAGFPIGDFVGLRVGGNWVPGIGFNGVGKFNVSSDGKTSGKQQDVQYQAQILLGGGDLLADIYPGRKTNFRFTVGFGAGPKRLARVYNREPFLDPEDWGTSGLLVGKTFITTDDKGVVNADVNVNAFRPYVGIGVGRPVPDKRVAFSFDFGVYFTGGWQIWTEGRNTESFTNEYIRLTSASVDNKDNGLIDTLGNIPVYPVLRFRVNIKLF